MTGLSVRIGPFCLLVLVLCIPDFVSADGIDNDGDGYCEDPVCTDGSVPGDCDDSRGFIYPGALDVPGNDFDENCSGFVVCFVDSDDDAYGTGAGEESTHSASGGSADTPGACGSSSSDGYDDDNLDCADANGGINPGATDVPGNDFDENCSGFVACFVDSDDDAYGTGAGEESTHSASGGSADTPGACGSSSSDGYDDDNLDCADANGGINPGATDVSGNDFDENCSGFVVCFVDSDDDGYGTGAGEESTHSASGGSADTTDACGSSTSDSYDDDNLDCDDSDGGIFPGAPDTCGDGIDSDCDGIGGGGMAADEDMDGCTWQEETTAGTSDCDEDSDDDLIDDIDEMGPNCAYDAGETNPDDRDTDDDLAWDGEEVLSMGTDPLDADSDDDGLTDSVEDVNHDGTLDANETDPMDADTDDDGLMEGEEDLNHDGVLDAGELNPLDADTDGDYLFDGLELGREYPVPDGYSDGWGLSYAGTDGFWQGDADPYSTTNPLDEDTDNDRLLDGEEDADWDGLRAIEETDPVLWDTDEDGYWDGLEVECGSDPLDPFSTPDCLVFWDGFESGGLEEWDSSSP